jgi:hypothetical protein
MWLWSMLVGRLRRVSARSGTLGPRQPPPERQSHFEPPRQFDLLRAAERDAIVADHLNARLQSLALVQVAPRRWVNGSTAPVRRVFEMRLLKGASMKARWGFSLDFVPHLSGDRICWHRSNRTARFDVVIERQGREYTSFLHGAAWLRHDLERFVPPALAQAEETWRRGSTLAGVLDIVREIRERRINSFYALFTCRLTLTFIFLCATNGDLAGAQAELEAFARSCELSEDVVARLAKIVQDAARLSK